MTLLLLVLSTWAHAADIEQALTWELSVDGAPVGTRTLKVKYLPAEAGMRRVLEAYTDIEAQVAGVPLAYEQRLTAHAGEGPASFHSVVDANGEPREIQGRASTLGWTVSIVERGRSRGWDLGRSEVDLSTADLLDPASRVPLSGYEAVKVLSVETGDVISGKVERLGASEVTIDGTAVPVQGLALDAPAGRSVFQYTSDGVLVKYETTILGKRVQALLSEPPPPGVDDVPVSVDGGGIEELEL